MFASVPGFYKNLDSGRPAKDSDPCVLNTDKQRDCGPTLEMGLPAGIRIVRQLRSKSMTGGELGAKLLMVLRFRFA